MSVPDAADELISLVALAERVQRMLVERGMKLSTAESCTGGLIAHVLTEVAGSSDYFAGGAVTYSDSLKEIELGVPAETLERHGAVSAQTCLAMAEGARRRYGVDLAVSVTGIAGPGGGSDAKPVGLTYIGVADVGGQEVRRYAWSGDRHANKVSSARAALELVLERLDAPRG
jgi:PncC family amidohydrolase